MAWFMFLSYPIRERQRRLSLQGHHDKRQEGELGKWQTRDGEGASMFEGQRGVPVIKSID